MMTIPTTTEAPAMPVYALDARVSYLGHAATVTTTNAPLPGWTDKPSAGVGITFDSPVRGMSRQLEVFATALLPL